MSQRRRLASAEIRNALIRRGVILNPPATISQLSRIQALVGTRLNPFVRSIYEAFDGFPEGGVDYESVVGIWPINEILGNSRFIATGRFPFAGFALDALVYLQSADDPAQPVVDADSGKVICGSTYEFWADLTTGRLDTAP